MSKTVFVETLERGVAAHQAGRLDEALESYRAALELRPEDAEAASLCGLALLHSGKAGEAMPFLQQAVEREPGRNAFRLNLAEGLAQTGRPDRAMVELGLIIASEPTNTQALSRFYALESDMLIARRDWPKLFANSMAWTKIDPQSPAAWRSMARAAFEDGRVVDSRVALGRALALGKPTVAELTAYAGLCLQALDLEPPIQMLDTESARAALDQAEALDPDYPQMLGARALLLMYLGQFAEAETYCRRCLQLKPDFVPAYSTLSRVRRGALDDADIRALQELVRRGGLTPDRHITAVFLIAHAYDARGEIDAAFATYKAAHALARERDVLEKRSYDGSQDAARVEQIVKLSEGVQQSASSGNAPRPIFIVGMPRSGDTLVESVLGAHPRVFACGERRSMRRILRLLIEAGSSPDESTLQDWAKLYFGGLPDIRGADHVTDRQPRNLEAVGLIASMLPNAVIVHVQRNPVEHCLSVYRHELNKHLTFAHDLAHIADYYRRQAQLAAHWQRTLPGRIVTVQYEDFAADFESAARRLLQACGLSWEPQCLEIRRAPAGTGRAQKYAKHLGPLVAALQAAGIDPTTGAAAD